MRRPLDSETAKQFISELRKQRDNALEVLCGEVQSEVVNQLLAAKKTDIAIAHEFWDQETQENKNSGCGACFLCNLTNNNGDQDDASTIAEDTGLRFGGCPVCGESGYVNVGRNHWGVCETHKKKWPIGSNLFSGWRDEDEETWHGNARLLEELEEVEPIYNLTEAMGTPGPAAEDDRPAVAAVRGWT